MDVAEDVQELATAVWWQEYVPEQGRPTSAAAFGTVKSCFGKCAAACISAATGMGLSLRCSSAVPCTGAAALWASRSEHQWNRAEVSVPAGCTDGLFGIPCRCSRLLRPCMLKWLSALAGMDWLFMQGPFQAHAGAGKLTGLTHCLPMHKVEHWSPSAIP